MRVGLTIGAFGLYGITFLLLHRVGGSVLVAFSVLPVALSGWLFGIGGGLWGALIAFGLNTWFLFLAEDLMLSFPSIIWDNKLVGTMTLFIIGGGAGWLHRINHRSQQELSERMRVDQALQASETRTRIVLENITDAIALMDQQGVILEQSPVVRKILGYSAEETVGEKAFDYVHPEELPEVTTHFQQLLEKPGNTVSAQIRFRHQDGSWRWLYVTATNLLDEPGIGAIISNYRDVTEELRVKESLQIRVAYDQSLLRLSRQLELDHSYAETMKTVYKEVDALLGFHSVWIYLDAGNETFKLMLCAGEVSEIAFSEYPTLPINGDPFLEEVWKSREIHVVLDAQTDPRTDKKIVSHLGNRTIVNIPLILHGNLLGFLGTGTFGEEGVRVLTEAQREYLGGVAGHMAVAISRIQLQEILEERIRFTLLLNRMTQTALEATSLRHVGQKLVDQLANLFEADACYLTLWDEARKTPIPFAASGELRDTYPSVVPIVGDTTLTASVLQVQHAFVLEDKFASPFIGPHVAADFPENSALVLPLIAGDKKLGAVILGYQQARTFTTQETLKGEQAAAQIALAIAKTQLFEETQQKADIFKTLYEISQKLSQQQDLNVLLDEISQSAISLLRGSGGGLYLYDPIRHDLECKVAMGSSIKVGTRLKMGEGMAGRVAETRAPIIVDDYMNWEHRSKHYAGIPVRATVEVPMIYGGMLVGVLVVSETGENTRKFAETDVNLLSLLATEAASAVYNTSLLDAERRRREEAETLREATSILAVSFDLDQILETLLAFLRRVVAYDSACVFLLEGDSARVKAASRHPNMKDVIGKKFPVQEDKLLPEIYQTRQPVILHDAQADTRFLNWGHSEYVRGWMGVPLWAQGKMLGVLTVDSRQPNAFTQGEASLAQAFANQAALAIDNARLLESERRRREEAESLRQVTTALMQTFDLKEILDRILTYLQRVIPYDSAHIALLEDHRLRVVAYHGFRFYEQTKVVLDVDYLPHLQEAIEERRPVIISATHQDPRWVVFQGVEYIQCWMGVPLVAKDRVIGLLNFDKEQPGFYTEEHALLAITFAGQVAVAIENARLFAEITRRQSELATLLSVSQVVSSSLDIQQVLEQVAQAIAHLLGVGWSALSIYDPLTDSIHTSVEYSQAEGFTSTEIGKNYLLADFPATNQVLKSNQPLIIRTNDPEAEPAEKDLLKNIEVATVLLLPLVAGGQTVGLVELYSENETHEFTREDIRLAQALADQVAIAIANAQLYDETRLRLAEMEAVNRISKALRTASKLETMFSALLQETALIMGVEASVIWLYDPLDQKLHQKAARGWFVEIEEGAINPGEGIAGKVFTSGESYRSQVFLTDPNTRPVARHKIPDGWGGICVPLRTEQEVVGVFFVAVSSTRQLTEQEIHLLHTIAEIAGSAIHRAQLNTMIQNQLQRLLALRAIDSAISASLDLRLILNLLLEHIISELDVDAACVLLATPHTYSLKFAAGRGFYTTAHQQVVLHFGDGLAGRVAVNQTPLTIPDMRVLDNYARSKMAQQEGFVFYTGVPLIAKGQVQGVLEVYQRTEFFAPSDWLDFLDALAAQAAIAIDSAQLFADLQRSHTEITLAYDSTLEGWIGMLDLRDKETVGHTQRVTELTVQLAQKMGLKDDQLVHLRRGALLHDIGKLAVSDRVLLKTGPLNPDEWEMMRLHPQHAFNMLSRIPFLRPALDIPYCHHEKWDGTGYPRGLKGEQIPLPARIFSVVDVWDALTNDRPYRHAWAEEEVRAYLIEQSGTHFDPDILNVFLNLLDER